MTMKNDYINLPVLKLNGLSAADAQQIDFLVCNYEFRKSIYSLRNIWGIPAYDGLSKDPHIESIEEIQCSCVMPDTPVNECPYGWQYKKYWDWHMENRIAIHNGSFYRTCLDVKSSSVIPKENGWLNLVYEVVLFNEVTNSSIPTRTEHSDGILVIDTNRLGITSARHSYDVSLNTHADIPQVELKIYRDMQQNDWEELIADIRRLAKKLPSPFKERSNIRALSSIADMKRQKIPHSQIAARIQLAQGTPSYAESSIGKLYQRALELGL